MKILHLSTGISQSSANTRLHFALQELGIESNILLLEKKEDIANTFQVYNPLLNQIKNAVLRRVENRYLNWNYPNREPVLFSSAMYGTNIKGNHLLKEADIIHLHWINSSFLSIKMIHELLELGKPIVWTLHDSWAFTGGCHVRYGCMNFQEKCGKCKMLYSEKENDLSRYIYSQKEKLFKNNKIYFIAPSRWMYQNIKESSLFRQNKCFSIPNTVDIKKFQPIALNKIENMLSYTKDQNKYHLLFGPILSKTTPYKGFQYLIQALQILRNKDVNFSKKIVIHIFGTELNAVTTLEGFECKYWGYINNQELLACLYGMSDVCIFPSIDDNLPNTVMESLSCATPVVAFQTGGIPEMVEHKQNGYIAKYKSPEDLCEGILWVKNHNPQNILGTNGRKKVAKNYNYQVIAEKYVRVYQEALKEDKE